MTKTNTIFAFEGPWSRGIHHWTTLAKNVQLLQRQKQQNLLW